MQTQASPSWKNGLHYHNDLDGITTDHLYLRADSTFTFHHRACWTAYVLYGKWSINGERLVLNSLQPVNDSIGTYVLNNQTARQNGDTIFIYPKGTQNDTLVLIKSRM